MTPALLEQPGVVPNACEGGAEMTDRTCSVDECNRKHYGHGLCNMHYKRWRNHGDPTVTLLGKGICAVDECDVKAVAREWCSMHYTRWSRYGDPLATSRIIGDDLARFNTKVDYGLGPSSRRPDLGDCWWWIGTKTRGGYGQFVIDGVKTAAHRWAHIKWIGPIPDGHQIDHLCFNPSCVNPGHLEAVTPRENTLRSTSTAAINATKTHCLNGHELTLENTYVRPKGTRHCRECERIRSRASYWRKRGRS